MKMIRIRLFFAMLAFWAGLASQAFGASGSWILNNAGNWSLTNNWAGGTMADGAGSTGWFTNNITAIRTVTIDNTNRTLGIFYIGDANTTHGFTLAASGGARLLFDNGGANAQLNQTPTSNPNTISTPLTLVDSTDIANESTNLLTVSGVISNSVAGVRTLSNTGSGSGGVTISGAISNGAGTLAVEQNSGTSLLTLSGANAFTGGVFIKEGTLKGTLTNSFGARHNLVTIGHTNGSANATLQGTWPSGNTCPNPIAVASGNSGAAVIINSGNGGIWSGSMTLYDHDLTLTAPAPVANFYVKGGVTGKGNLTLNCDGTSTMQISLLPLNNAGAIINSGGGSVAVAISGGVGSNVTAVIENSTSSALTISTTELTVNSNGTTLVNNNAGGSALLTVSGGVRGGGDLVLSNNSAIANGITLTGTAVNHAGAIINAGTGADGLISAAIGSNVTAIVEYSASSALTVSGALAVNAGGTTLANNNAGGTSLLTVSGGVSGSGNLVLNNNSAIANGITLSGGTVNPTGAVINSGSGAGDVLISANIGANVSRVFQSSATSRLVLLGANTFSNGASIESGALLAANAAGSATGPGAVTIGNGGTLQGNGTVAGAVIQNGTLSPGLDGTAGGTLTLGNLTWNGGGVFNCKIASIANNEAGAGADYDRVIVTNALVASPGGTNLVIRMDSLGQTLDFQTNRNYSLKVITCGTGATLNPGDVTLDTSAFLVGGMWSVTNLNKSIYVVCMGATSTNKNYWTGTGNWSTDANWSLGHAPLEGEDVEFDVRNAANCTADAVSNNLGSLTLTAGYTGTVTFLTTYPGQGDFSNVVIAGDCTINGGALSQAPNPAGNAEVNRLSVRIGGNLTVASKAAINVDGKGFAAGSYGPGKGSTENYAGWGASHGGWDAERQSPGPYGNIVSPTNLGSSCDARAGGGAILLEVAGDCVIDGTISAIGLFVTRDSANTYNAGAGGSILIKTGTIDGNGLITARGGTVLLGGSGGGGRIAMIVTNAQSFGQVRVTAGGGTNGPGNYLYYEGSAGTIYQEHAGHEPGKGILTIAGAHYAYRYMMPNWPVTDMPTATATRAAVNLDDFSQIILTNGGNLGISSDTLMTNWNMNRLQVGGAENSFITIRGTNGVVFPSNLTISNYSLHMDVPVLAAGDWTVAAGGNLSHNFKSAFNLTLDGSLTIQTGGLVSAHRRGYVTGGIGGVTNNSSSGPSHGGRGRYNGMGFRPTYGSVLGPTNWGSDHTRRGGGAIKLDVSGTIAVYGTVDANADTNFLPSDYYGSGSGGSVWLRAGTFAGTGLVQAAGGNGYTGPGGGGRIALVETTGSGIGGLVVDARGGYNSGLNYAAPGTIYRQEAGKAAGRGTVTVYAPTNWTATPSTLGSNTYCELPATTNGVADELKGAPLEIVQRGRVGLSTNLTVGDLSLVNGTNTFPQLMLNGFTLTIDAYYHDDWGNTNWVRYDGGQIVWKTDPGTLIWMR